MTTPITKGAPASAGAFPCHATWHAKRIGCRATSIRSASTRSTSIVSHSILGRLAPIDSAPDPLDSTHSIGRQAITSTSIRHQVANSTTPDRITSSRQQPHSHANSQEATRDHEKARQNLDHRNHQDNHSSSHNAPQNQHEDTPSSTNQQERQNHLGSTHHSTQAFSTTTPENAAETLSRKHSEECKGRTTKNHTLASLPNRSVRPAGAAHYGETRKAVAR